MTVDTDGRSLVLGEVAKGSFRPAAPPELGVDEVRLRGKDGEGEERERWALLRLVGDRVEGGRSGECMGSPCLTEEGI